MASLIAKRIILLFGSTSSASGSAGGGSSPSLDFSSATNSQYAAIV